MKKPLFWVILISILMVFSYTLIMLNAAHSRPVAPLDDAYIHFQYAKQMALGQPWQYNPGQPISTGATSLLYPLLLAAAYRLGFAADNIVWPALFIGATSLMISAALIYQITLRLLQPKEALPDHWPERIALLAALLFLFSGAITWSYLNGMETGVFTLFILAALHNFIAERSARTALFLVLGALSRPEGIFLMGIAWLVALGQFKGNRQAYKRQLAWMTVGVLLSATPYLINIILTGTPVATGAQAKSWLGNVPFVFTDLLRNMSRMFLLILERMALGFLASRSWPIAPGMLLLALVGAISLWQQKERWVVLLVSGWFIAGTLLAATLITALWQIGRYQVPFLALLLPFIGAGIAALLGLAKPAWRTVLAVGLLLWGAVVIVSTVQALGAYYDAVASLYGQQVALARAINRQLPDDALVAVHDAGAIRYLGKRDIYDMIGLTTQGAADAWRHGSGAIFEQMADAKKRPTHFATYPDVATIPYLAQTSLFGRQLFVTEPYGLRTANAAGPVQALYEAEWAAAADKGEPQQEDIRSLLGDGVQVSSIDLADLTDEEAHDLSWTIGRTQPGFPTEVRQFSYRTDFQKELLDGGRLISGSLVFPVAAEPGEELVLAARLHAQEAGAMAVTVNGRDAGLWRYPAAKGHWLETVFPIAGDLITDVPLQIELQHMDQAGTAEPIGIYHLWATQGLSRQAETTPQAPLGHQLGSGITLQGYDLADNELRPGDDLQLTLYWTAENRPEVDAKVFLHLYNDRGELVAQIDQRPFDDTRPPYTWLPGQQIVDPYRLPLAADLPPGTYELATGLYDPDSGERLGARTAAGETVPENRIFLEQVLIKEK